MAGSNLVGMEGRRIVGKTVLALQSGRHAAGPDVPHNCFYNAVEGLGEDHKTWLDAAAADCQRWH